MRGFINLLKPVGMTSHDCVGYLRRAFGFSKVGHTGTLDPGASGVLPICIDRATRLSDYVQNSQKSYRAEITFGVETDSGDSYGEVVARSTVRPTEAEVRACLISMTGEQDQKPPMHSAIKINGEKLYNLARQGKAIEVPSRRITVYDAKLIDMEGERALVDFTCSSGTYVRSLVRDLGKKCGTEAYMSFLVRTESSIFTLENAVPLETLTRENIKEYLIDIDEIFVDKQILTLSSKDEARLYNGLEIWGPVKEGEILIIKNEQNYTIALAKGTQDGSYKIHKNLK